MYKGAHTTRFQQFKSRTTGHDFAFVFVYIYNRAHHPQERGPPVYIKSLGVVLNTRVHTTYHHTLFFSQIFTNNFFLFFYTSFLSYILSDNIYNNK